MIHITEKNVNLIEQEPNRSNNTYNDIIEEYISTLQTTLVQMKNGYIYALVKKHYYKDANMKKRILLQENIPQKRNNVKKAFNAVIEFIKDKCEDDKENQKYYYNKIIEILEMHETISDEDLENAKKMFKENRLENLKNIVHIIKDKNENEGNILKNGWIKQKKNKKLNPVKLIAFTLPFAFAGAYIYNLIKS